MSKPKIAFVYDAVYPYINGGGERRFYELGTRLSKMGYEVHWYGMKLWDGPKVIDNDGITMHGICRARPLYTKSGRRSISQALIFGLSSFKLLFADFDVIDCCGFPYFSLFPTKLAATIKRKPLYSTWHEVWGKEYWDEYLGKFSFVGFWIEKLASKMPDTIIANSKHTERLFKDKLGEKDIKVVTNGIDFEHISKIKPNRKSSDLIYVGRLVAYKQANLLVESLASLKKDKIKLKATIIGKGPEKKKLVALAKKLGVSNQVRWLHSLEIDEVYGHMKASKLFILPSRREGFGIVAIEAMANGTPVIINNVQSNAARDLVVKGVNGFRFSSNTNDNLTALIKGTVYMSKEMEKNCVSYSKKFDWITITKGLARIYSL
jgi:glycosyltransferase involved in cell wall biosynthesis